MRRFILFTFFILLSASFLIVDGEGRGQDIRSYTPSSGVSGVTPGVGVSKRLVQNTLDRLKRIGTLTFYKDFINDDDSPDATYSVGSPTATVTATRSSSAPATYIDSNGVIQVTTTSNTLRFTKGYYDTTGFHPKQGLLIENSVQNRLTRTDGTAITSDVWTDWSVTNEGSAPAGTVTKSNPTVSDLTSISGAKSQRMQYTGTVGDTDASVVLKSPKTAAGTFTSLNDLTVSFWAKTTQGADTAPINVRVTTYNSGGTELSDYTSSNITINNYWSRYTYSIIVLDGTADNADVKIGAMSGIAEGEFIDLEIYGVQVEESEFASSFVPTNASALTRGSERLSYLISGNRTAATETIAANFNADWILGEIDNQTRLFDSDTKSRYYSGIGTSYQWKVNNTDSGSAGVTSTVDLTRYDTRTVAMVAYGTSAATNTELYNDGVSLGSNTTDYTSPAWGTNFYVGCSSTNNREFGGIISNIAFYANALDVSGVQSLSGLLGANLGSSGIDTTNVSYGASGLQVFDYYPAQTYPNTFVIVIHGGGFDSGNKSGFAQTAEFFQSLGYPTINMNYRLVGQGGEYPAMIDDVLLVMNYAVNNYGATKFILYGHSSGGAQAMLVALAENDSYTFGVESSYPATAEIITAISTSGVYDYNTLSGGTLSAYQAYADGHDDEANVLDHADSGDIPILLIAGELDNFVGLDGYNNLIAALSNESSYLATTDGFDDHNTCSTVNTTSNPVFQSSGIIDDYLQDYR